MSPGGLNLDFEASALDGWIRHQVGGLSGDMLLEPIGGGQSNPTFFVSYGQRQMVLRKQPSGPGAT